MQLICETGGVAVLAHPWALKNPVAVVQRLKDAGLQGIEVYRSDGKLAGIHDSLDPLFPGEEEKIIFFLKAKDSQSQEPSLVRQLVFNES